MVPIIVLFSISYEKAHGHDTFHFDAPYSIVGCAGPGPSPEQQARQADQQGKPTVSRRTFAKACLP